MLRWTLRRSWEVVLLLGVGAIAEHLIRTQRETMSQIEELRSAISQLGTDLLEAVQRVEQKIGELGQPDPDLSADIAAIREMSTRLDSLAADAEQIPDPAADGGTPPQPDGELPVEPDASATPAEGGGVDGTDVVSQTE